MTKPQLNISTNPREQASEYIAGVLKEHLAGGEKVLWLVPGGSAIAVVVLVAKMLEGFDCSNLTISLTDERYGEVGHADSSWFQLKQAGFNVNGATYYVVLQGKNKEDTIEEYRKFLENKITEVDYSLGLFGIGADGHTAGILPGSSAVSADAWASGYQGGNYYRITVTPQAISRTDEVVVYAVGPEKKNTLLGLESEYPLPIQPAQSLKQAGKFTIFTE